MGEVALILPNLPPESCGYPGTVSGHSPDQSPQGLPSVNSFPHHLAGPVPMPVACLRPSRFSGKMPHGRCSEVESPSLNSNMFLPTQIRAQPWWKCVQALSLVHLSSSLFPSQGTSDVTWSLCPQSSHSTWMVADQRWLYPYGSDCQPHV